MINKPLLFIISPDSPPPKYNLMIIIFFYYPYIHIYLIKCLTHTNYCVFFYFRDTTGFPVFIGDFICLISSNPLVKCFLSLISSTALHQELKS